MHIGSSVHSELPPTTTTIFSAGAVCSGGIHLVSVPDPKPTPARITFSITHREGRVIRAGWGLGTRLASSVPVFVLHVGINVGTGIQSPPRTRPGGDGLPWPQRKGGIHYTRGNLPPTNQGSVIFHCAGIHWHRVESELPWSCPSRCNSQASCELQRSQWVQHRVHAESRRLHERDCSFGLRWTSVQFRVQSEGDDMDKVENEKWPNYYTSGTLLV